MRSQALFYRSCSLLKSAAATNSFAFHPPHLPRPAVAPLSRLPGLATAKRFVSTANETHISQPGSIVEESEAVGDPVTPADDPDKPRIRRSRVVSTKDSSPLEFPDELNILWTPEDDLPDTIPDEGAALPHPQLLQEALNNLHITLHPQTQHRAAYVSSSSESPLEPTLALYCPIEGGDYVIDATVWELARRTGSEVLVLDTVQLAAGEWGHFGKGLEFTSVCACTVPDISYSYSSELAPTAAQSPTFPDIPRGRCDTRALYPLD